jgi:hypothetical protein
MRHAADLRAIIQADVLRWSALAALQPLTLPDAWIAAGFVRDAIWDHLHGTPPTPPQGDVDMIYFDPTDIEGSQEQAIEARLRADAPAFDWSVKNQARMHLRNGDAPYASTADAMRHWPETATAVAVRLSKTGSIEINAPFGLDDLFAPRLKPTAPFATTKRHIFEERIAQKRWLKRYPMLRRAREPRGY